MIERLLFGVFVLLCVGCAGPTIASRAMVGETDRFVRLDTFTDARATADLRFDHPAELSEADLTAILLRVQVLEQAGLLERKPFPQPLFSSSEVRQVAPGLQKALRLAKPTEWAVFYLTSPGGTVQEVTSGGLFLKGNRLHVVVANHRERIPNGSAGLGTIRTNPLTPWGGKGATLSFDPVRFVSATQSTWVGGSSAAPASELVLDYRVFLAEALPPPTAPGVTAPLQQAPAAGMKSAAAPTPPAPQAVSRDAGNYAVMKEQLTGLQAEVERLRRRLEEQDDDIAQLKTRVIELDNLLRSPSRRNPAR